MKIIDLEDQQMVREGWLADYGVTEADVMEDGKGEFIYSDLEAETCEHKFIKVYLPEELTNDPF